MFAKHALEEVRARVDFELPRRRLVRAPVEGGNAIEVLEEIGSERCVDVHARSDTRIHLLLNEPRVEMPGIERYEADVRHRAAALLHGHPRAAEQTGKRQDQQSEFHVANYTVVADITGRLLACGSGLSAQDAGLWASGGGRGPGPMTIDRKLKQQFGQRT